MEKTVIRCTMKDTVPEEPKKAQTIEESKTEKMKCLNCTANCPFNPKKTKENISK